MRFLFLFTFSLLAYCCMGQKNISGSWEGKITQNEGGYRPEYRMELFLKQEGTKITGRSYVYVDDIAAEMIIEGELHSNIYFRFKESSIIEYTIDEGMEWCLKTGQLLVKIKKNTIYLEGFWQGTTSFSNCTPGRIYLKRIIPRA